MLSFCHLYWAFICSQFMDARFSAVRNAPSVFRGHVFSGTSRVVPFFSRKYPRKPFFCSSIHLIFLCVNQEQCQIWKGGGDVDIVACSQNKPSVNESQRWEHWPGFCSWCWFNYSCRRFARKHRQNVSKYIEVTAVVQSSGSFTRAGITATGLSINVVFKSHTI